MALFYLGEYEKANYAKYLQSLDFDMGDFTYAECILADIDGLFTYRGYEVNAEKTEA